MMPIKSRRYVGGTTPIFSVVVAASIAAIRVKPVWDAIFDFAGYTYSSSFMNSAFLDDMYMICNNQLK